MKMLRVMLLAVAALTFGVSTAAPAAEDVLIVYDASGSMWGQIDGVNKIVIARDVMADLVNGWPQDTNLGLVAYGHRRAGDCRDIETLIKPGPVNRSQFIDTVKAINPKGKTPIAASLEHAADVLKYRDNNATIVLVSDGLESCNGDPCAVAAELEANGVNFTAHVVGFDLDEQGNEALSCIADNTGGIFVPASNAAELEAALQQVQAQVEQQEPVQDVEITAPKQVNANEPFTVSWRHAVSGDDQIVLVPRAAEENTSDMTLQVADDTQGELAAPAQSGVYQVRYVSAADGQTLASATVKVVSSIEISAPEQVTTGAKFDITWTDTIADNDYYTIVPAGTKEGKTGNRGLVHDKLEGTLKAPAQPGLYEVRYILREGMRTLASTPVEVVEAELGISAPEQVTTGARFDITWTDTIAKDDYYTIVPAGTKEGKTGNRGLVHDKLEGSLKAPAQPGLYEVRYILRKGMRTLASTPVEVVEAELGISAPEQVTTGARFNITWTDTIANNDYYTIVAAGTKEGKTGNRGLVHDKLEGTLKAPAQPGLYEVRYILREGMRTLASTPVEVIEPEITISAPEVVRAGTPLAIEWSDVIANDDYYTIVAAGTKEGKTGPRGLTHGKLKGTLKAPAQTGLYEVRYILREGMRTLASTPMEVVAEDAALDSGAGLKVPPNVAPGASFTVTWTGGAEGGSQRIALAKADQADFTWIEAHQANADKSLQFTAPDETGRYEIRFLDVGHMQVLGRAIVQVE